MGLLTCRDKCNVSDWLVLVGPVLTVVVFEISLALTRQSGLTFFRNTRQRDGGDSYPPTTPCTVYVDFFTL